MATNRNHHFVPQFYLRNFGNGGSIDLYNLSRKAHVAGASIKGQCQRPYLYGRDPAVEKSLSNLEGAAAGAIADIIRTNTPPETGSAPYFHLVTFILFQWGRTPAAGAVMDAIATKMVRMLLKASPKVPDEMRDGIESLRVEYKSPITNSLKLAASMPHLLFDLELKVLVNTVAAEFITSDAPVVLFNQWCQGSSGMGTTGMASRGLQVFFPLSPRHVAVFYDPSVYRVGKRQARSVEVSAYDVRGINRLQLIVAEDNLYHSGAPVTAAAIDRLPFEWRRRQAAAVKVHRAVEDDGKSHLLHLYQEPSDARLDISTIQMLKRAKAIPLKDRSSMYREEALALDEYVRGPRKSRYGPPPSSPRMWRLVDEE